MFCLQLLKDFEPVVEVLRLGIQLGKRQDEHEVATHPYAPQGDATTRAPSPSYPWISSAPGHRCVGPGAREVARVGTWTRPG